MKQAAQTTQLFTGTKSVPLSALREWHGLPGGDERELTALVAFRAVPWVYRAVNVRAEAIAGMPWRLLRGETDVSQDASLQPLTKGLRAALYQTEASLLLYGLSYLLKERAAMELPQPRWLAPSTITPRYSARDGVTGFRRRILAANGAVIETEIAPENMVWLWLPSLEHELGPGIAPVEVALEAAGVLRNLQRFASGFFERGAIKGTLLTVEGNPAPSEKEKLENWWKKIFRGVSKAWETAAVSAAVKPVVIGEGLSELSDMTLTDAQRKDVAVALGVPPTVLDGQAANYATAQQDDLHFYTKYIIPRAQMIEEALNEHLFEPLDLRFEFQPQKLEAMQAAELEKAGKVTSVVGSPVLTRNEGRELLGFEPVEEWDEAASAGEAAKSSNILGYHIEQGVVTRNEARATVGLPPIEDAEGERQRQVIAQLKVLQAAKDAGLPLEAALELAELGIEVEEPPPPAQLPPPPAPGEEEAPDPREEEAKTLRRWLKKRGEGADVADFEAKHLSAWEKAAIHAELFGVASKPPFPGTPTHKAQPDENERGKLERGAAKDIRQALSQQLDNLIPAEADETAVRAAPGRVEETSEPVREAIRRTIHDAAAAGVAGEVAALEGLGLGIDWTLANTAAAQWANAYSYELVRRLNDTTRAALQVAIEEWVRNGEPLDRLIAELEPVFGKTRAELVASTEVTRAYAEGNVAAWKEAGVIGEYEIRVAADERVCPVCGPKEGERHRVDDPAGMPPFHPRCRCWVVAVVD